MTVYNKNKFKLRKYYQNQKYVLKKSEEFVRKKMEGEGTGHDFFHIERVTRIAEQISNQEKDVDLFIVRLGALFHDIADWKFTKDLSLGGKVTRKFLEENFVEESVIEKVQEIVDHISHKSGTNKHKLSTIEGKIVQDADRIDATGALGVGRAFAYGGFKGIEIHNPKVKPRIYKKLEDYDKYPHTTISHFYEKILLIKDNMNTKTGKKIATRRHKIVEKFLKDFLSEWDGNA